jgi:hypothetical protein
MSRLKYPKICFGFAEKVFKFINNLGVQCVYIKDRYGTPMAPPLVPRLKAGHFVGDNMYKTPLNFHIGMRGGAPDLCSPMKMLFTD